uniref:EGF-like domain-containing protein n=2 Tax=Strongyloides stercoralis TaxID=6248 RepID=A0AAF5DRT7_STRER
MTMKNHLMKNKPINWFSFYFLTLPLLSSTTRLDVSWIKKDYKTLLNNKVNNNVAEEVFLDNSNLTKCKNPLLDGSDCSQYLCINFGHNYLEASFDDDKISCVCPPGPYGTHCEQINCPNYQMTYDYPLDRSLISFITYNNLMKKMDKVDSTDPFIDELCTMVSDPKNSYTSFTIGASCAKKTPIWTMTSFETNNLQLQNSLKSFFKLVRNGNSTNEYFRLSDIHQLVSVSQSYSDINIFTNMGVTDSSSNIAIQLSLIKQTALANRVRINIFVVSQLSSKEDIYNQTSWKPLIELSETTGGFIIIPYDRFSISSQQNKTIKESIIKLFPVFNNGRNILKTVLPKKYDSIPISFQLSLDSKNKRTGYLFISGYKSFNESSITIFAHNGSVEEYFILNKLKVYKITFDKNNNQPIVIITKNANIDISLNIQLLSALKELTFDLGYTINDMADSSSPLPIINVPNNVVGRRWNMKGNVTLKLNTNSNIQTTLINKPRNNSCYFNYEYMTITSTSNDISYFSAISNEDNYQEWIPFTFSDSSQIPFKISDVVYLKKNQIEKYNYLLDNNLISQIDFNNIEEDMMIYENYNNIKKFSKDILLFNESAEYLEGSGSTLTIETTTPTSTQSPIDNKSQKSFSLAFYSRKSLINNLLNQISTKSLINRLKKFLAKFKNNYDSYIFGSFFKSSNPNSIQAIESLNYVDFLSEMMNRLNFDNHDDDTCFEDNTAQQILIKILQNNAFEKSSDIYLITDQLYGKESNDKQFGDIILYNLLNKLTPRINVLLVETRCSNKFNDINYSGMQPYWELTKRTGGAIIKVQDPSSLLNWFSYLTNQTSSKYENIYTDNQPGKFVQKKDSSNSFNLANGHKYTVWGTIQTTAQTTLPTTISIIDINNNSICTGNPFITIEDEFGISSPCTIPKDGKYYVQLDSNYFPTKTFQVRVVEFNADYGYKLSFVDTNGDISDSPLYGETKKVKILFNPYDDTNINENNTNLTVTIFDSTQKKVFYSETYSNDQYSYLTNNSWFCNNANKMYYIQIQSQKESRMFSYTCLNSNNTSFTPDLQCPPWLNQSDCSTPICGNGGTLIEGVCSCLPNYTGPYCDHYIANCTNDNNIYYNDFTTSIIVVVDLQNDKLDDLKNQFEYIKNNMDDFGQKEYILFSYDSESNISPSNMNIYVTSEKKKFFYEISKLTSISGGITTPGAHVSYLKAVLSRQSGSKSVLIWVPHRWECGTEIDMELVDLILKKNVDMRIIYYNNLLQYCKDTAYYIMLGNGLFTKFTSDTGKDDNSFGYYVVNGLLGLDNSTGLIVYDSYFNYDTLPCDQPIKTKIVNDGTNGIFITVDGFEMDKNTLKIATKLTTNTYYIDMMSNLINEITFTCQSTVTIRRGYIIEGQSPTKIAYGYNSINNDSFKNFAPISYISNNYLFFNIKNYDGNNNEFISNYPEIRSQYIYPMNISTKEISSVVNRRDICNNKWIGNLPCSTSSLTNSILRVKITGTNDNKKGFSKVITTVCKEKVTCKNGGTFSSSSGLCICDSSWIGQDCSIPKCFNGYIVNNQQCICDKNWYGIHCDNNSPIQPTVSTQTIPKISTTPITSTINPQICYDNLNITLVLIFDETNNSIPYIQNYINFYSSFQKNIKSYGPGKQINLAAEYASLYPTLISFASEKNIPTFINSTKKTDAISIDNTFNTHIYDLLSMCNTTSNPTYCYPQKNKYFIIFGATNHFVEDTCTDGNLSFLNGIKSIIFTFGNADNSSSWWNTCYKKETNDPTGKNIKLYDKINPNTDIFTTAFLDICRFENII